MNDELLTLEKLKNANERASAYIDTLQKAVRRLRDKLRLAEQENATLKRELKSLMERT